MAQGRDEVAVVPQHLRNRPFPLMAPCPHARLVLTGHLSQRGVFSLEQVEEAAVTGPIRDASGQGLERYRLNPERLALMRSLAKAEPVAGIPQPFEDLFLAEAKGGDVAAEPLLLDRVVALDRPVADMIRPCPASGAIAPIEP